MREIKFRAWDTHEEVMNRVDYVDFVNGVIGMSNENVRDYEEPIHRVNIMQSTSLKDKNGVEIYEGDVVELNVPTYKTTTKIISDLYDAFILDNNVESISHIEVIGNVYEDKLLEEQADDSLGVA